MDSREAAKHLLGGDKVILGEYLFSINEVFWVEQQVSGKVCSTFHISEFIGVFGNEVFEAYIEPVKHSIIIYTEQSPRLFYPTLSSDSTYEPTLASTILRCMYSYQKSERFYNKVKVTVEEIER